MKGFPPISKKRKLNILVSNIDPNNSYTYRFFGNSTQLPPVDNNNPIFEPTVVNKISVGQMPLVAIVAGVLSYTYILNFNDNSVSVIDTNNNVIATISTGIGLNPQNGVYCPLNQCLYICNGQDTIVSVIDVNPSNTTYNTVIKQITVGNFPQAALFVTDNNLVYILNNQSATFSVIDPLTNLVVATTSFLGGNIVLPVYVSYNRSIYVTSIFSAILAVVSIDTNDIYASIPVGISPRGTAYDSTHQRLYTISTGSGIVSISDIATNSGIGAINLGVIATGYGVPYFFSSQNYVYIPGGTSNNFYIIDTTQGVGELISPIVLQNLQPEAVSYNPSNNYLYLTSNSPLLGQGTVSIYNYLTLSIIQTIVIGDIGNPTLVYNPSNQLMYMPLRLDDQIAYLSDFSYIPVTIIVNGGINSIYEIDREFGVNPINIDCIQIDASNLQCLLTSLQEKDKTDTGFTHSIPLNILKERTSFNSPFSFIVKFCKDKFYSSSFDGTRYLQHIIPPSSQIMFYIEYSKYDNSATLGIPENFQFSDNDSPQPTDFINVEDRFTINGLFGDLDNTSTKKVNKKKRYITAKSF